MARFKTFDKVFFDGFINNCLSYSVDGKFDNLTGFELVGNERLEELELRGNFCESPVQFASLGKVTNLRVYSKKKNSPVYFDDIALTQIEELEINPGTLPLLERIIKLSQKLKKVTFSAKFIEEDVKNTLITLCS